MFKLNLAITARTGATLFATVLAGASAWSEGPSPPQFRNGRACWDRLCPVEAPIKSQSSQKSATQAPTASKQAIEKQTGATSAWTPPSSVPIPPKQIPSKATAFYRYPMIYRAEAPPPMPPGTSQQPYVQATQGVWYWPGADSIKIPVVAGFDPAIDPSRVMQW
jgi:hypothetical protein